MQAVALKHRLDRQNQALARKEAEVEELKEQVVPDYKAKEMMNELREAAPQCGNSDRSQVQYKPRWGSTASVRSWIREAVGKSENQSFNDLCSEVANKGARFGKKNGWTGKITFICAIIPQDSYKYNENYSKWWYYEYDLIGKYYCLFLKVDHDRQADRKLSKPIIDEIQNQATHYGFAVALLNQDEEAN